MFKTEYQIVYGKNWVWPYIRLHTGGHSLKFKLNIETGFLFVGFGIYRKHSK